MSKLTKDTLFKPSTRANDKWEVTNTVARSMTEAEATAREKKTERLRKLRMEAGPQEEAPKPKRASRKPSAAKKTASSKSA
jgi:hypothetical protein